MCRHSITPTLFRPIMRKRAEHTRQILLPGTPGKIGRPGTVGAGEASGTALATWGGATSASLLGADAASAARGAVAAREGCVVRAAPRARAAVEGLRWREEGWEGRLYWWYCGCCCCSSWWWWCCSRWWWWEWMGMAGMGGIIPPATGSTGTAWEGASSTQGSRYEGTASPPGQNFAAGGDFTFDFGRARLSGSNSETLTLTFSIYLKKFLKQYESIHYVQPPPVRGKLQMLDFQVNSMENVVQRLLC